MTSDPLEDRLKRAKTRVGGVLKDKWHIDALLGVGGMAAVYLATHRNNGKRVAVKMLHTELSVVSQVKTRFLREGYASNKVNHPGVVSILDDDVTEDGSVYLVMELLEGENLEQRRAASGGRLDLQEVLWIVDQTLDVLGAAHAVGVIHRDIKPENIFLTRDATLKVLDFGLARVRDPRNSAGLTRTNMLMGTLDFMPPEQARGKWDGVDARSDIWSVGATMFMLLTGHPVHEESTLDGQLKAVTSRPPRSLRQLRPDLPASVIALVDRALAFLPRDRWPDAYSMQEAVRDAYNKLGGELLPTSIRPPPVEPSPGVVSPPVASPSWDTDLAQTRALERARFDEDDVTRALPPSLPFVGLSPPAPAAPAAPASPSPPLAPALSPAPAAPAGSPPLPALAPAAPAGSPPLPTLAPAAPAGSLPLPTGDGEGAGGRGTTPDGSQTVVAKEKRKILLLVLASLPLWLAIFWGIASLRSCGATPPEEPQAPSQVSAPVASEPPALSAPEPPVPPAESASAAPSANARKPPRPPHRAPPRKK